MNSSRLVAGIFLALLLAAPVVSASDFDSRPHPLYGSPVIGNSAEALVLHPSMPLVCGFDSQNAGTFTTFSEGGFRFDWIAYGDYQIIGNAGDGNLVLMDSNPNNAYGAEVVIRSENDAHFVFQSLYANDFTNNASNPSGFGVRVTGYLEGALVGSATLTPTSSAFTLYAPSAIAGKELDQLRLNIVSSNPTSIYGVSQITLSRYGDLGMSICDFDSTADVLIDMPERNCQNGAASSSKQQLDVAAGDYDGDGQEEIAMAFSSDTNDPFVHAVHLVFAEPDRTTLGWLPICETQAETLCVSPNLGNGETGYNQFGAEPGLRMISGKFVRPDSTFAGDKERQLLLGIRSRDGTGQAVVRLQLLSLLQGNPHVLASIDAELSDDYLGHSARFDVAAGDFNGDGIDDIALGGIRWTTPGVHNSGSRMEPYVKIYSYHDGNFVEEATYSMTEENPDIGDDYGCWGANTCRGSGRYLDRIAMTTGAFRDTDLRDQIFFAYARRWARWNEYYHWQTITYWWDYDVWANASLRILSVAVDTLGHFVIEDHAAIDLPNLSLDRYDSEDIRWEYWSSPAMGAEAADLDSDGIDEIVLAATNKLRVYEVNPDMSLSEKASLGLGWRWNDSTRRNVQIADLDVDINSESWAPEILVQDFSNNNDYRISVLQATHDAGEVNGLSLVTLHTMPEIDCGTDSRSLGDVALVAADFNGDAVRFGTPSYRRVTNVIQPTIVLNPPPVHYDILGAAASDTFDLANCYGPRYVCEDAFNATYTKVTGTESTFETTVHSDWGIGAGIKTSHSIFGVKLETSLKTNYKENFQRMNAETHTLKVTESATTNGTSNVYATKVSYDMWEYPVLAGDSTLGYVAVVRPEAPTKQWFNFGNWPERVYPFTREPGNILSYSGQRPQDDPEVAEIWRSSVWSITQKPSLQPGLDDASWSLDIDWSFVQDSVSTKSWDLSVDAGASVKAWGIRASVNGHYGTGELNTHRTSVTNGISIHMHADRIAYDADYEVEPYVYRSADGFLVVDYAVNPVFGTGTPTFWDQHYTSAPDPAFNSPRRYWLAKGYALTDSTTFRWSPDIWVQPSDPKPGDMVTITATLHNYSLAPLSEPVAVRFYAGTDSTFVAPLHQITVLQGLWNGVAPDGAGEVTTIGGLPPRGSQTLQIRWPYQCYTSLNQRLFAVIDPDNELPAEIHKNNNIGYVQLVMSCNPIPVAVEQLVPSVYALHQNVPNPFNPTTRILFSLGEPGRTTLRVYSVSGRLVTTLVDMDMPAGPQVVEWRGHDATGRRVPSGIYFYRLESGPFKESRKMVLLK